MLSKIIEKENNLNALLPILRLEQSPSAELLGAARAWSQAVWEMAEQLGAMPLFDQQVEEGLKLALSPIFICGVHRSGTTLVRDLLDGHPDLVVLPSEGTYYTNLEFKLQSLPENERAAFLGKEWLRRLANPINQPPYWLLGKSSDTGSPYVNFARYVMAWWPVVIHKKETQWPHTVIVLAYASCRGNLTAKLWVDKTPTNERFLKRIWHEIPEAKIIHVIRDPRATLASRKKMQPDVSMRSVLSDLKLSFRVAVDQLVVNDPRFLLLQYEELCENPSVPIERLASFLHIDCTNTLNQPTVAGIPSKANSSFNREPVSGKILKLEQHRQQEVSNLYEQQLLGAYVGALAARLNYPVSQVGFLRSIYLRLKHRLL